MTGQGYRASGEKKGERNDEYKEVFNPVVALLDLHRVALRSVRRPRRAKT